MSSINKNYLYCTAFILLIFNFWLWQQIFLIKLPLESAVYFLDVGQGDSQLLVLGNIKILIDGGKDKKVLGALDEVVNFDSKYIDLIIMTHPDLDHYGGLIDVISRYKIGYFIHNGRESSAPAFRQLLSVIKINNIPTISLSVKDRIRYQSNLLSVISPDKKSVKNLNDNESGLVILAEVGRKKILFTADIGLETESRLLGQGINLKSDILKIAHHGSKYSSSASFIKAVNPDISAIGVGRNSYGHPASAVLKLLAAVNSVIYRTDMDGTIKIPLAASELNFPKPNFEYQQIYYPIIISQVQSYSESSATDEFIKIYNSGNQPINLAGWSLKKQTKSGKEYSLVSAKKFNGIIAPKGEFVTAHYNYTGSPPDLFYSSKSYSLAKSGNTILLYDEQDNLVDKYSY